jgi:hypothetical protein
MSHGATRQFSTLGLVMLALAGCSGANGDLAVEICDYDFRSELIGPDLATEQGAERWIALYNIAGEISSNSESSPAEKAVADTANDWFFTYGRDIEEGRGWGSMSTEWADLGIEFGSACALVTD